LFFLPRIAQIKRILKPAVLFFYHKAHKGTQRFTKYIENSVESFLPRIAKIKRILKPAVLGFLPQSSQRNTKIHEVFREFCGWIFATNYTN
jgi:hypothetical protein